MLVQKKEPQYKYKTALLCISLLLSIAIFYTSCKEKKEARTVERAFYYWRSAFKLNAFEAQQLRTLGITTLYIKYFDVDWDAAGNQPVPVAKITADSFPKNLRIIPTVFITNACILYLKPGGTAALAKKISTLINDISNLYHADNVPEIQVDCDWTVTSKEVYFALLRGIKLLQQKPISATIRLHQVKYADKSGVPPVDRGLLMCYNMGNLKNPATGNSIIETAELKKYIGTVSGYPLDLDVALPLFNWKVLFRNGAYKGLIQDLPSTRLDPSFVKYNGNRYTLLKDTLLEGFDLKKDDVLRDEASEYETIISSAAAVSSRLKNTHLRVALYHLDSVILKKYSTHELETIYNSLR